MAEEKNIHSGHRQRMLKKYLEHGIDCFEEHEILEIFLYTAYSRRNTNLEYLYHIIFFNL